jgi:hypothetical protein
MQTLSSLGVLPALEQCLQSSCYQTRSSAMEIMAMVVDHNAQMAREYMLTQVRVVCVVVVVNSQTHFTVSIYSG